MAFTLRFIVSHTFQFECLTVLFFCLLAVECSEVPWLLRRNRLVFIPYIKNRPGVG